MTSRLRQLPWEAIIWLAGLICLAFYSPENSHHFTLCPFRNLGLNFCPGCGLGRSISYFLHGELIHSISVHPLGIFAVIILSFRIVHVTKLYCTTLWRK